MTGFQDLPRRGWAAAGRRRIKQPITGRGVIERITSTGAVNGDNPEMELLLTIELPGRTPYTATHRQVVSRYVAHTLEPGTPVPVRVDADDPQRFEIG